MENSLLESQLHASYWEDGLLDVFCGLALLMIGVAWWFEQHVLGPVSIPLLVPLWLPIRKRWIEPRAGYVEFGSSRRHRTRTSMILIVLLGVGTFVLFVAAFYFVQKTGDFVLSEMVAGLPAMLVGIGAAISVTMTSQCRFLAYACLLILAGMVTVAFDRGPAPPLVVSGMVVLATGVMLLARFFHHSEGSAS